MADNSPEHMSIFMPSSLQFADIQRLGLVTMASQELELSKVKPMMPWKDLGWPWDIKLCVLNQVRVLLQGE